uniref:branchpoint-bridging protein-like n=1 Tax=Erigeron canadensis TaxID=72917 RepID=UPI001CB88DC5|nr:branchpoint-bridging protein-like [Erigeron canadensis]
MYVNTKRSISFDISWAKWVVCALSDLPTPYAPPKTSHIVGPTPALDMPAFVAPPSGFTPTPSTSFIYHAYDAPPATDTAPPPSPGYIVPPQSSTCMSSHTLSDPSTPYAPLGFEHVASPTGFEPTAPPSPDFATPPESPDDGLQCI